MSGPASPVSVTAISEHPGEPQDRLALVVKTGPVILGVAARVSDGWTAGVRAGIILHRVDYTGHDSAASAVGAVMGGRVSRRLGVRAWSEVHWSDAAGRAARDAWGAGVAR